MFIIKAESIIIAKGTARFAKSRMPTIISAIPMNCMK